MSKKIKKISIVCRPGAKKAASTIIKLIDYLKSEHCLVVLEKQTAALLTKNFLENKKIKSVDKKNLKKFSELMLVVGGDGSLLHGAKIAVDQNLPVLGINRGYLGFLADIHPNDKKTLKQILQGNYKQEKRFLLSVTLKKDKKILAQDLALNEAVIVPNDAAHMMKFSITINDEFVCCQRADGLIAATPTGSTAYALSAGGPILQPKLHAIVLIPMFPHTLSNRPLVIENNSCLKVEVLKTSKRPIFVSCDGRERFILPPNTTLHIQKHKKIFTLIHPKEYSYFSTLREKLGWHGERRER